LIQGRSRQIPPFWQPWFVAAALATITANVFSWMFLRVQPLDLFVVCSVVGSLIGARLARSLGSRRVWFVGLCSGLALDVAFFGALWLWAPRALIEIVRVG
jgi:hypothetical protein